MNIEICEMTEASAGLVSDLEAQCFFDPWPYQSFVNTLSNNNAQYYTLFFNGDFVGYIGMYNLIDEVSIINVAVSKDHRGKGFGRMLMEKAEDYAKAHGCPAVALEVRRSNKAAIALYEAMGYEIYGLQENYYTNPKEDAVLYRKVL